MPPGPSRKGTPAGSSPLNPKPRWPFWVGAPQAGGPEFGAPTVVVVDGSDQRQRQRRDTPPPVVLTGLYSITQAAPAVTPLEPVVSQPVERRRETPLPVTISGAAAPAPITDTPLEPVVAEPQTRRRDTPPAVVGDVLRAAAPAPTVDTPLEPIVSEPQGRRRDTPPPIVLNGLYATVPAPVTATPPAPVVINREDKPRKHEQADSRHGPIDDTAPQAQLVERERRRELPLPAISINGLASTVPPPFQPPPPPIFTERPDQRARYLPQPAITLNGLASTVPPPQFTPPPTPTVVDRVDRRPLPFPAQQLAGPAPPPPITPPASENIDRPERRRPTPDPISISAALLGPQVVQVFPPTPNVSDRPEKRRQTPDAVVLSGALLSPFAFPPKPFVVPLEERRRFIATLPPDIQVGYDDSRPPRPLFVDADGRDRRFRVVLPPIAIHGSGEGLILSDVIYVDPYDYPDPGGVTSSTATEAAFDHPMPIGETTDG